MMRGFEIFHGESVAWPWHAGLLLEPWGQLHKFASENVIQTQLSGNLLGNIQIMSPPSIDRQLPEEDEYPHSDRPENPE
jgi:hypothetical protein